MPYRLAGMSKRQQVTAIRLANVPAADFEKLVEADTPLPRRLQSGMSGSSPQTAEPAALAAADPALSLTEKGVPIAALSVERKTSRSTTIVPTYRPFGRNTLPRLSTRPTTLPDPP